ncbi:MAG: DUF1566 domain-containing protein [Firmicutes bacterium]|nr:DUF1566 domain-containing protein [Bacillota bacterium]
MKSKRRGFTLIELLAVIVILAIIALIAVPVIMNIISSARENAFKDTMYGVIKAGELYYAEQLLTADGMTEDVTFTFSEDGVSPSGLSIKGSLPTSGTMTITKDGKILLNATDGTYTATKDEISTEINVVKGGELEETPTTPETPAVKTLSELARTNDFATSVDACATSGTCVAGTKFAIEVAPGDIQNFYVVSDASNKVTLIMDKNVDENTVAWITKSDYLTAGGTEAEWDTECDECGNNNKGPITALNYLESQTSGWTNIAPQDYTLTDSKYGTITRTNARARMLTETEANAISSNDWSYGNLAMPPYGYWTSSAVAGIAGSAWFVYGVGSVDSGSVDIDGGYGVRPVIEISK